MNTTVDKWYENNLQTDILENILRRKVSWLARYNQNVVTRGNSYTSTCILYSVVRKLLWLCNVY